MDRGKARRANTINAHLRQRGKQFDRSICASLSVSACLMLLNCCYDMHHERGRLLKQVCFLSPLQWSRLRTLKLLLTILLMCRTDAFSSRL